MAAGCVAFEPDIGDSHRVPHIKPVDRITAAEKRRPLLWVAPHRWLQQWNYSQHRGYYCRRERHRRAGPRARPRAAARRKRRALRLLVFVRMHLL